MRTIGSIVVIGILSSRLKSFNTEHSTPRRNLARPGDREMFDGDWESRADCAS
jgi:hypothetical protein